MYIWKTETTFAPDPSFEFKPIGMNHGLEDLQGENRMSLG